VTKPSPANEEIVISSADIDISKFSPINKAIVA
jgi:hypothetical protein